MTSKSKNVYIDKSDDMVNEYNNTHQRTIKMRLIDAKSSTYIAFVVETNIKDSQFEVADHARIS